MQNCLQSLYVCKVLLKMLVSEIPVDFFADIKTKIFTENAQKSIWLKERNLEKLELEKAIEKTKTLNKVNKHNQNNNKN